MQQFCKNMSIPCERSARRDRRALTLLELIVVLAILVTLSGMVVPLIEGLGHQTNASTNATVVNDVNRAVGAFVGRFERLPSGWDSLIDTSGNLFDKLHAQLTSTTTGPILEKVVLNDIRAESLTSAGIYQVNDATTGGSPNTFTPSTRNVTSGITLAMLTATTKTGVYNSSRLSLAQLEAADVNNDYVVLGLGGMTTLRGAMMRDVPLISSADPNNNYARVLCVFMVPGATSTASFPAKYIGCFLPDGTSQRMNLENYNNLRNGD
jgi:type II secretory pathway pseudopilin PulG